MRKKNVWKPFFWEAFGLVLLSAGIAFGINHIRADRLPLSAEPGYGQPQEVIALQPAQAMRLAAEEDVVFVDARDALAYADGHIAGAVNLPYSAFKQRDAPLTLILYCDGPECAKAANLAELLQDRGIRFAILPEGVGGWFAAGGLVEAGK